MALRRSFLVVAALVLATGSLASAAVTVDLSLTVDQGAETWQAWLTVADPSDETLGLHGIYFDVYGTDGLDVATVTKKLPVATETLDFATFAQKGFNQNQLTGTPIVGGFKQVGALQSNVNEDTGTGTGNNVILEECGEASYTETNGNVPGTLIGLPLLIGEGTYTGLGTLHLAATPTSTTLLPSSLPAEGESFATFSPDTVNGDSVIIPEPATLLLLGVGGVGALLRRRRRA